jgi:hypothetical protein
LIAFQKFLSKLRNADASNASSPERIPDPSRSTRLSTLMAFLAIATIVLVFVEGLRRGMDHVTMFGPENEQAAIAIALSDVAYHLNAGYLGYATVHDRLVQIWNRGASSGHDPVLIQNGANRELLNEAISAAASLGPQQRAYVGDRTLMTMIYTDMGSVDIYKIGFRLFGYRIESAYYTFFLILFISTVTYLLAFWDETVPKLVLLCTLFAFYIEMHTALLTLNMPTFSSERHGTALALIPLWHFIFLIIYRRRVSLLGVLAALIQMTIMLLAVRIRGAATWVPLFIVSSSVVLGFFAWRTLPREQRTWQRMVRNAMPWPVLLLVGGILVNDQYVKASLHPVYFTDDVLPYHGLWSSAFAGVLFYSPELMPPNSKVNHVVETVGIDSGIVTGGLEYLNEIAFLPLPPDYPSTIPPSLISPWTGTYKFRLMDETMRRATLRLARLHPLAMLELYLFKKPYYVVVGLSNVIKATPGNAWLWLTLLGGTGIFVVAAMAGALCSFEPQRALLPILAAMPFAALGPIWAWASSYTLLDLALLLLVFLQVLLCTVLVIVARLLVARWHRSLAR